MFSDNSICDHCNFITHRQEIIQKYNCYLKIIKKIFFAHFYLEVKYVVTRSLSRWPIVTIKMKTLYLYIHIFLCLTLAITYASLDSSSRIFTSKDVVIWAIRAALTDIFLPRALLALLLPCRGWPSTFTACRFCQILQALAHLPLLP